MINPEVDNIVFDSILTRALIDNSKDYLSKIPSEIELSSKLDFSDEFLNKMNTIIAKLNKEKSKRNMVVYFKKSVAGILIVAGLIFGMLMLSQPVRATIQNVISEWFEKYTRFEFQSDKVEIETTYYKLGYIPMDFTETDYFSFDEITVMEYTNFIDNKIIFEYSPTTDDYSINLDNENSDYKSITLNSFDAYLFESKIEGERNYLLWDNSGYTFKLISELNVDELIKISESVKIN